MKKVLMYCLVLSISTTLLFTSCSKQDVVLEAQTEISHDEQFLDAVKSSLDIVIVAQDNNWLGNAEQISELLSKTGNDASAQTELESLLGMSQEAYLEQMKSFAFSINNLFESRPEMKDMTSAERQAFFADAIAQNEELAAYVSELQAGLRGCLLQDICNLVVTLAELIGGPFLCDYLANAVPVVGPILCTIILDIASDLLTGICNVLPC